MNKQKVENHKKVSSRWRVLILLVLIVLGSYWAISFFLNQNKNYAAEVARPLENQLQQAGAIKQCDDGDAGRGIDNRTPHYGATYLLDGDKEKVTSLVYDIARDNGYNLQHASPANRGPLDSVADEYIENWYFDNSSKKSSFGDLLQGSIELTFKVEEAGATNDCDQSTVSEGKSIVGVGVTLPSFKQP